MAFDQKTRNLLQRTVSACRNLLDAEFAAQRRSIFGINDDGTAAPLETVSHLSDEDMQTAKLLRDRLNHLVAGLVAQGKKEAEARKEAVGRVTREQAFTVLNRLAALRMSEEREIVLECVRQGTASEGFQLFMQSAGGALGGTFESYRTYLFLLFDELAIDLGVLFSRWDPAGLLFPRQEALEAVLKELNGTGTAATREDITPEAFNAIWAEDETIGWIYQYYNDQAERKKMRDESSAPRNSRELAVRNQFFTPRYVVEFLTDNTLGRIWYEMTHGDTTLKEQCRYLVRRPNEIFLKPGETAPEQPKQDNLSQEDLLKEPLFIPHRPLKDPRTILMLDPACGSMHFGLYAFDLFEVIYDEAWALEEKLGADTLSRPPGMKSLHATYAGKDAFLKDVPRLIIEHNLHGIDIDPRCAQIAGLSLWLRAQKAWQRLGLEPAERPAIKRSNIVCAEPMPGEKELLSEFVDREFPAAERVVCLRLLEAIFDKMQLAGEAGSLLKIEEEIRSAIEDAKKQWKAGPKMEQSQLFDGEKLKQQAIPLDYSGLTESEFWDQLEEKIYAALRNYAEQAENGGGFQRRLFAEDAARGFAFIDICKKRYDVALMNPPFGGASLPSKSYLDETYGDTKGDVYKAFVECFQARLLPSSMLGIISSRTGFFLGQSEDWRTRVVLRLFRPLALADLGLGVLDAMVEVAAYVLRNLSEQEARDLTHSLVPVLEKVVRDKQDRFSLPKWQAARDGLKRHQAVGELEHLENEGFIQRSPGDVVRYTPFWKAVKAVAAPPAPVFPPLVCVRALAEEDKEGVLDEALRDSSDRRVFVSDPAAFKEIPACPFAYWVSSRVRTLFRTLPKTESESRRFTKGLCTTDDDRFLRTYWEIEATAYGISCEDFCSNRSWAPFAKGGAANPFYSDMALVINWASNGAELKAFLDWKIGKQDQWSRWINAVDYYFRPGLTWPIKNRSAFKPWPLPRGCIFAHISPCAFFDRAEATEFWGLMSSSIFNHLLQLSAGWNYEIGVVQSTVIPDNKSGDMRLFSSLASSAWAVQRGLDTSSPISHAFLVPAALQTSGATLTERAAAWAVRVRTSEETVKGIQTEIDELAFRLYGLDAADRYALEASADIGRSSLVNDEDPSEQDEGEIDHSSVGADFLSYTLGSAFGRWDIRYATGEQAAPELPDPFAPLPVCPPGQLQNAQGLPARPEDVPAAYPVRIPWDGILVDDPNHPLDIERRVREVIEIIWSGKEGGPTAEAIEHEACEILGVKSLRDYFRKPAGFFADHLKRYSKSRRQAPIYWPLATASGSYTLWIYYHRLTPDTLYKCLQQLVEPKIKDVEQDIHRLRTMLSSDEGGSKERDQLKNAETLLNELKEMHAELTLWAPKWKPNLNDGVLITASPLWKLFRLPKWRTALEACWKELDKGDYDWAHLAHTLRPDRVREKCKKDRSVAIAHGLEELCEIKAPEPKKRAAKKAAKKKGKLAKGEDDEPELIKED